MLTLQNCQKHSVIPNNLTFQMKNEPISIPSLRMQDVHVDLDLENSMISVASITSEIAETATLGADAGESDTEMPEDVEEDSVSCELENLPRDSPQKQLPRRITPRDRRKQAQDRCVWLLT